MRCSHASVYWKSLCSLDAPVHRALWFCAGILGMLGVATYLPWAEVYLTPPFPARHRGMGTIFALVDHPIWTGAVFIMALVSSVALLAGKFPRLAAGGLLLFFAGIVSAARPLTSSALGVLCVLYAWVLLMPRWQSTRPTRGVSVLGLRVQLVLIYWCGTLFKLYDPAWQEGYPLAGALVSHTWESGFGRWLVLHLGPSSVTIAAKVVTGVELIAPLALLFPWPTIRRAGVLALASFHLGTAILMKLELFPFAMLAMLMVFMDGEWLDSMKGRFRQLCPWLSRFRQGIALLLLGATLALATAQAFLPRLGLADIGRPIIRLLRPLNDTARFDQRWAMFTTSTPKPSESRARAKKTYRTTRLLVKTLDGTLFDPFTGRVSSVETSFREGHRHPAVSRKALSYLQKQKGRWRDSHLRSMARWSVQRTRASGRVPVSILVYRFHIPVDFHRAIREQFEETEAIARLWVRIDMDAEGSGLGALTYFGEREAAAIRVQIEG